MFVAPLPQDTPTKNQTADPPPATGPYEIVKSDPGRGWSYARNPQWAKTNGKLMPEIPSGHVDKIDITVIRNDSTQVNELEQGKTDWMQTAAAAGPLPASQEQIRGHPVPGRADGQYLLLLDEHEEAALQRPQGAPGCQLRASTPKRWNGSTPASRLPTHQILPPEMPGYQKFDLYPHNMAKAKALIKEANPSDRNITVWGDSEPENEASDPVLPGRAHETRLQRQAEGYQR